MPNPPHNDESKAHLERLRADFTAYLNSPGGQLVKRFLIDNANRPSFSPALNESDRVVLFNEGKRFAFSTLLNFGGVIQTQTHSPKDSA